jgi:hypothetical protein
LRPPNLMLRSYALIVDTVGRFPGRFSRRVGQ